MKLALIIPTQGGPRMHFVAQALRLIKAQTRAPDRIYMVDSPPVDKRPDLVARVRRGIQQAQADGIERVLIWEDDDYYAPTYIEAMMAAWKDEPVISLRWELMYHLRFRRWHLVDPVTNKHPSLHSMGVQPGIMTKVGWPTEDTVFLDRHIWEKAQLLQIPICKVTVPGLCVAMKHGVGLCGMQSHKVADTRIWTYDDGMHYWLRKFVEPPFVEFYIKESQRLQMDVT